jgi:NAD(P)-dependent dehydrogenase (short-subunit alcohol dehydrogenase family)
MPRNTFKDKVIVIIGGAKNLGGLVAEDFAKQRAQAIVVY